MYALNLPTPPLVCLFFLEQPIPSKTIDLNWSYAAPAQKVALTICQDRVFQSFSCVYHYHQF